MGLSESLLPEILFPTFFFSHLGRGNAQKGKEFPTSHHSIPPPAMEFMEGFMVTGDDDEILDDRAQFGIETRVNFTSR